MASTFCPWVRWWKAFKHDNIWNYGDAHYVIEAITNMRCNLNAANERAEWAPEHMQSGSRNCFAAVNKPCAQSKLVCLLAHVVFLPIFVQQCPPETFRFGLFLIKALAPSLIRRLIKWGASTLLRFGSYWAGVIKPGAAAYGEMREEEGKSGHGRERKGRCDYGGRTESQTH